VIIITEPLSGAPLKEHIIYMHRNEIHIVLLACKSTLEWLSGSDR